MKSKLVILLSKLKYNSVSASYITILMLVAEQFFRISHPLLTFNLDFHKVTVLFSIAFVALLLVSKRAIQGIFIFITIFMLVQFLHFNYYGTWVFPLEYLLLFTKFTETIETFTSVLDITIVPLLIILPMGTLIYIVLKNINEKKRLKIPYLSLVLILFLIFIPLRVYVKEKSKKGARPNIEVSTIVNGIETLGYFFGRIVPQKILGNSRFSQPLVLTPPITVKTPDVNVVVIMGESLTYSVMSLYGGQEKTTPLLDALSEDENFLKQIAFTSGVVTDVALPSFFNILYEPDSTEQIISTNTCLFKMAKKNGFETYFYSAQSQIGLAYIKSYLCLNSIDHYLDGTNDTGELKKNALDGVLLQRLDSIDFNTPKFIILHQIGSHSPYELRYPKEFAKFTTDKNDRYDRNSYKNSILYTDYIITQIIKKLKEKTNKPTYVFFTSDHGEGIQNHRGHGNLKLESNYEVPFVLYTINTENKFKKEAKEHKYTSHYEIAKTVAETLGYDVSSFKDSNETYIVCGKDLCGIAGFLKLDVQNNKILKKSIK